MKKVFSIKNLLLLLFLISLILIFFKFSANLTEVTENIKKIKTNYLALAFFLTILNYIFRFFRWWFLLKVIGVDYIPFLKNLLIFLSGFLMTLSPGKIGESIKAIFIYKDYKVSGWRILPVVFMERYADLLSVFFMLVLSGILLKLKIFYLGILIFFAGIFMARLIFKLFEKIKKIPEDHYIIDKVFKLKNILISTFIGLFSWSFEALGLWVIIKGLREHIGILKSIFAYSSGTLIGAVSFLPGGLGATEISLSKILMKYGLKNDISVSATILIRATTLWFGVFLGIVAYLILVLKMEEKNESSIS